MTGVSKRNRSKLAVGASWLFFVVAVLALVAVHGCKVKDALKFDHQRHADLMELDCDTCHPQANGEYGGPTHEQCLACHEIKTETPSEKCLLCHKVQQPEPTAEPERRSYQDVIFKHAAHEEAGCTRCHGAGSTEFPSMDDCFACHRHERDRDKCAACHQAIRRDSQPRTHTGVFTRTHGSMAENGRCELCHGQNSCDTCHHTKKPKSHVAGWKKHFHGSAAAQNRDRCTVCHEGNYCDRCHQQKPYYHYGTNWKFDHRDEARRNSRSCLVCHDRNMCADCHRGRSFEYGH
ncbi:MAG: hypothetical protein ACTSXZ_03775 [Alphaproteobacteria bacterium]